MKDWMFAQGWLAIAAGVALIPLLPFSMAGIVSVAFGLYLVMDAYLIYYGGRYDADETHRSSRPLVVEGLLAGVIGLYSLFRPLVPVLSASGAIGLWFLISGLLTLLSARTDRVRLSKPGAYLAGGVLSLAAGVFLLVRPLNGTALHVILIVYLFAFGALMLAASGGVRRAAKTGMAIPH